MNLAGHTSIHFSRPVYMLSAITDQQAVQNNMSILYQLKRSLQNFYAKWTFVYFLGTKKTAICARFREE